MLRHQSVHYLKRLEGLGNVVLLKEVCHWGWAFRQKSRSLPPPPLPLSVLNVCMGKRMWISATATVTHMLTNSLL